MTTEEPASFRDGPQGTAETTRRRTLYLAAAAASAGLTGCLEDAPWADESDAEVDDHGEDGSSGGQEDGHDDGDGHDHGEDTVGHPEPRAAVEMVSDEDGHHFVSHVVHVETGGSVEWVLESGFHDTVAYHPDNEDRLPSASQTRIPDEGGPWASDVLETSGDSFERTFDEEGVYDYVCTVRAQGHMDHMQETHHPSHESMGMVGRVIVGEPDIDPDHQPAMQPPSGELPEAARKELRGFNETTRQALDTEEGH